MGKVVYYSDGNDEIVHDLDHWQDLLEEYLSEDENTRDSIILEEQKPMDKEYDTRWCTYHVSPIEHGECSASQCSEYEPQNGKRGKCRYKTYAYEGTGVNNRLKKDGLSKI